MFVFTVEGWFLGGFHSWVCQYFIRLRCFLKRAVQKHWFSAIRLLMQSPISSLIDQGPNKDLSLFLFHYPSLFNEVRFVLKIPLSEVLFYFWLSHDMFCREITTVLKPLWS